MIVWPGLRRSVSAISRLFNSASFVAPLTHTAVPTRAASGTTATFTRATAKTVENNDGYLVTLASGEIGFPGARRVRNLIAGSSEVFSGWTGAATVTYGVSDPDGGMTASTLTGSAANTERYLSLGASPVGGKILSSWWIRRRTGTGSIRFYNGSSSVTDITSTLTTEWQQFSSTTTTSGGTIYVGVLISTSGDAVDVWHPQTENVTAQTTQTAGEYVSVGVVQRNKFLYSAEFDNAAWTKFRSSISANATTSPDGTLTADKLVEDGTAGATHFMQYNTAGTVGDTEVLSISAKPAGRDWMYLQLGSSNWAWFNVSTGTVGTTGGAGSVATIAADDEGFYRCALKAIRAGSQINYVMLASADNVISYNGDGSSGLYLYGAQLESTALTEYQAVGGSYVYHGSGVDGVKCYSTDINGAAIPSSTLLGYQAEGARTNLCLQSNAFTTTWAAVGTPAATQNATGPDGGTTAWTLTDNDGAATEGISQDITLTAATHTFSIFVKKTSGATAFPIIYAYDIGANVALCTVDTNNGVATVWTAYTALTIVTSSARCASYNDDYWRVSLTYLPTAASWRHYIVPAGTANATQSTGTLDVTAQGSAVFYGAQVELGSSASSYIPTTTVAVARNTDVESVSTSNNIAAAAGSVYLEYTPTHTPSGTIALWGTYVDASNYTAILHDATNLIFRKRIAGVNYDATIANAFVSGTTYKACATWGTAGTSITLNGTEGTPHANTTAAQIAATMQWGADGNSLQQPFASIRNCRDWLRQLSASERTAVTA